MTRACWVRSPVLSADLEVTLVTDRDAAVPVLNARSQQRGVAYGSPQTRHGVAFHGKQPTILQVGDLLQTSGLDGIYPAGMPVAKIVAVDRRADSAFARITLKPMARPTSLTTCCCCNPVSNDLPERVEAAASTASSASAASAPRKGAADDAAWQ